MRTAICISGQMRTYRQASMALIAHLVKPLNADVFVHTWDKAGNTNKLILFLPRGFHFKLPLDYWHSRPDLLAGETCHFADELPELYRELQHLASTDEIVTTSEIRTLYDPVDHVIEPFAPEIFENHLDLSNLRRAFNDPTALNAAPMFYKIDACDRLRRRHEERVGVCYDVVIRTRPDLMFPGIVDISGLGVSGKLFTLHNPFYDELKIGDTHSNDMFFFGDSETMTYTAGLWEQLPSYWDPSVEPEWPLSTRGPELVLNRHLRKKGLHDAIAYLDPMPHRVVPGIDFSRLLELLHCDLKRSGRLPPFVADCVGICQGIWAADLFLTGRMEQAEAVLSEPIRIDDYVCTAPFGGRARVAQLSGDETASRRWRTLAEAAGQREAFPELFDV